MSLTLLKDEKVCISDREMHDRLLKNYVDIVWKNQDVEVDWEWSGPGMYRIHEHTGAGLPCVSLKWEGV